MPTRTVYPFLTVAHNFVINLQQVVWFELHSDGTVTVCLSQPDPQGEHHINLRDKNTVKDFLAATTTSTGA